jgi:hypothetical protein
MIVFCKHLEKKPQIYRVANYLVYNDLQRHCIEKQSRWFLLGTILKLSCYDAPVLMQSLVYKLVLLLAILCVVVVFLAPSVDLPETALRAQQYANNVMICITLLSVYFFFALARVFFLRAQANSISKFTAEANPLLCMFLC